LATPVRDKFCGARRVLESKREYAGIRSALRPVCGESISMRLSQRTIELCRERRQSDSKALSDRRK
jgi:hypothetical protein